LIQILNQTFDADEDEEEVVVAEQEESDEESSFEGVKIEVFLFSFPPAADRFLLF
jgi:hypothetical protein